jgi:predicted GNAT family N-acyltransferase
VPEREERDAEDAHAFHVLARISGRVVGTGRLVEKPDGRGKIGRMAVLREARSMGVGAKIMEHLTEIARERGLSELFLDAQIQAMLFYARLGYTAEGETFLDAGIPHRRMRRTITDRSA